jgi:hypothetical protein
MLGTTMSKSSSFATSSQSSGARSAGPASAAETDCTWLHCAERSSTAMVLIPDPAADAASLAP